MCEVQFSFSARDFAFEVVGSERLSAYDYEVLGTQCSADWEVRCDRGFMAVCLVQQM